MEEFANEDVEQDDGDNIDYSQDPDLEGYGGEEEDADEANLMFADFFDAPKRRPRKTVD